MQGFRGIIERMVRQEVRALLEEKRDAIRDIVGISLLPELQSAVRTAISEVLNDMIGNAPGPGDMQESLEAPARRAAEENPGVEFHAKVDSGSEVPEAGAGTGRYVYCIGKGVTPVRFGKIGIEENEVYAIACGDLCAVVHDCPAVPYRSEDEEVVRHWVSAHQRVVDAAWERYGCVIPMGFDCIIRENGTVGAEENVREWVRGDLDNLKAKMERIEGRAEYCVQIFWDTRRIAENIARENPEMKKLEEEAASKPRGVAYMHRRKLEELLKKEMGVWAEDHFRRFYGRLRPHAEDVRVEKIPKAQDPHVHMLMNVSCLMSKDQSRALGDELEKIQAMEGFSVRYTGPWPPYSFV